VIFTTAYDQHAIRAFEVNAVDYLLKPYKQPRFRTALRRARQELQGQTAAEPDARLAALLAQMRSGAAPRIRALQPLVAGQYCLILQTGARLDMTRSLHELQERLGKV
jgi:two-component system LytT family response regulator